MKFAISIHSAPHSPSARRALRFVQAVLGGGHELVRLFFYQEGVHNACGSIIPPQDEINLGREGQDFIDQHRLDSVVCIAAALRRGVLNHEEAERYQLPAGCVSGAWELSGLGQLHDAIQSADRLVCFGGH